MHVVVPLEVRAVQLGGGDLASREEVVRVPGRRPQRVDHGAGTPNVPSSGSGALASASSSVSDGSGIVLAERVDDVERVRRGLDPREVELCDLPDRLEDGGQLL